MTYTSLKIMSTGVLLVLLSSCTLPWQTTPPTVSLEPDSIERSFSDDLAWVDNYGRPEYVSTIPGTPITPTIPGSNFPKKWKVYKHPSLPISFAYPADAVLVKREIDLDNGDNALDIIVKEPHYSIITLTFQRDLPELSHVSSSQKKTMVFGGLTGIYYNARNFKNGNPSLEKFIANLPNSRYGIHIAGQGPLFQTLLNSIQLY